jgi:hypothetical protein
VISNSGDATQIVLDLVRQPGQNIVAGL